MIHISRILAILLVSFALSGCDNLPNPAPSSDQVDAHRQEALSAESSRQLGLPAVKNFNRKRMLKQIVELQDQADLATYAYLKCEMTGKLVYVGRSLGFPISSSVQYTNPMKIAERSHEGQGYIYNFAILPQADPDGLFSPASAEGTYVVMIDPSDGQGKLCYFEDRINCSPFPLTPETPGYAGK